MSRHRVLIFRTGQLGDTLAVVPAIRALREHWKEAETTLLYDRHVGKPYVISEAIFRGSGLIDDFMGYPVGDSPVRKAQALLAMAPLLFRLRRQRFDLVVHLEPELKTPMRLKRDRLFFRLAGIKEQLWTLKYRRPRSPARPLESLEHETDFFLRALREEGVETAVPGKGKMDLGLGPAEDQEVKTWRARYGLACDGYWFGVGPGSKMQSKRWPVERFREVIGRLVREQRLFPVYFGGPEDREVADQLIREMASGASACGELSVRGAARALQDCRFYLGNDTGTMHLAVAAGIPCVAVFSARDVPGKWYPYGEGHKVHRVAVDCEGCMLQTCIEQRNKCLTAISAEGVYASCLEVLEKQSRIQKQIG